MFFDYFALLCLALCPPFSSPQGIFLFHFRSHWLLEIFPSSSLAFLFNLATLNRNKST